MDDIKIIIAAHKQYKMPADKMYMPVFVGSKGKSDIEGFKRDDEGENISEKNPYFCELTGLYWAWKNLNVDYIGLAHYRRNFICKKILTRNSDKKIENIMNESEVREILKNNDIILPKKRHYYIENLYSHYEHTMYIEHLAEAGKIINEKYPEYVAEFENLKKRTSAHMFNMLIMKKEILDKYCEWLFEILFELEKRIDVSQYDKFHARFFGRVSELLLDVWINTNNLKYAEVKVMDLENINWFKKGFSFLESKIVKKKYNKSF